MQQWKVKALEAFPEIKSDILASDSPMQLWIELIHYFDKAYEKPINESFIKRVYDYQNWCLEQDGGETTAEHLPTWVATCFREYLPTNAAARKDNPRWFTLEDVLSNLHFFSYHLSAEISAVY